MNRVAVFPEECPQGWQRVGMHYRRRDGVLLKEFYAVPGSDGGEFTGAVSLHCLLPGDWRFLARHLENPPWFEADYAGWMLVGANPGPNDFTYWMNVVNTAIPLTENS